MSSIISHGNIRISGVKKVVSSHVALGVGLAIAFSFGLVSIAGVVEQPLIEVQTGVQEPSEEAMKTAPVQEMTAPQESRGPPTPPPAESPEPPVAGMAGEGDDDEEEISFAAEEGYLAAEPPPALFAELSIAMPYVAAAIVGSVVFIVARKRMGGSLHSG